MISAIKYLAMYPRRKQKQKTVADLVKLWQNRGQALKIIEVLAKVPSESDSDDCVAPFAVSVRIMYEFCLVKSSQGCLT